MLMPETAVNKNSFSASGKHQVGFAWKVLSMEPEAIAQTMRQPANNQLGLHALALYPAHIFRAAFRSQAVHEVVLITSASFIARHSRSLVGETPTISSLARPAKPNSAAKARSLR